jgi:hypothetical protein
LTWICPTSCLRKVEYFVKNIREFDKNNDKLLAASMSKKNEERVTKLLDAYRKDPLLGITGAAHSLGISRLTIFSFQDILETRGLISRDENGVSINSGNYSKLVIRRLN